MANNRMGYDDLDAFTTPQPFSPRRGAIQMPQQDTYSELMQTAGISLDGFSKDESGYVGGALRSLGRGAMRIPEAAGNALEYNRDVQDTGDESQMGVMNRIGKYVSGAAKGMREAIPQAEPGNNPVKRALFEGTESIPLSLAYAIPSYVGAAAAGAIATPETLGLGALPAAIGGAALGQAITYPIMQRSTAQETYEQIRKSRPEVSPQQAAEIANRTGHWEAGPEAVANIAEGAIYGVIPGGKVAKTGVDILRNIFKPGLKQFAKNTAKSYAFEAPSEALTAYKQTEAMNEVMPEGMQQSPRDAALWSLAPTAVMTGAMGGGGTISQRFRSNQMAKVLSEPLAAGADGNFNFQAAQSRIDVADMVYNAVSENVGEEAAENWKKNALRKIANNEPIPFEESMFQPFVPQQEAAELPPEINTGATVDILNPAVPQAAKAAINLFGPVGQPVDFRRPDYTMGRSTSNPDEYIDLLGTQGRTAPAFTIPQAADISMQGKRVQDDAEALDAALKAKEYNDYMAARAEEANRARVIEQKGAPANDLSEVPAQDTTNPAQVSDLRNEEVVATEPQFDILSPEGVTNEEPASPSGALGEVPETPGMVESTSTAQNENQRLAGAVKAVSPQGREVTEEDIPHLAAAHLNIRDVEYGNNIIEGNRTDTSWSSTSALAPYFPDSGVANFLVAKKVLHDASKGIFPPKKNVAQWRLIEMAIDHEKEMVARLESTGFEYADDLSEVDTSFEFGANVEKISKPSPDGKQEKLFATPPTFGKKSQGRGVVDENPMLTEMKEREAEKKQEGFKFNLFGGERKSYVIDADIVSGSAETEAIRELEDAVAKDKIPVVKGAIEEVEAVGKEADDLRAIGKTFGRNLVFVRFRDKRVPYYFTGAHSSVTGIIYLNIEATEPHIFLLGHEVAHAVQEESPELFYKFFEKANFNDIRGYAQNMNLARLAAGMSKLSDKDIVSEFGADIVGEMFTNDNFWAELVKREPTLFHKILAAIIKAIGKITPILDVTSKYSSDFKRTLDAAVDMMYSVAKNNETSQAKSSVTSKESIKNGHFSLSSEVTGTSTDSLSTLTSVLGKKGIDLTGKVEAVTVKGEQSDNLRKIAALFGQEIVFVRWNGKPFFNGLVLKNDRNTIYVSVDASKSHMVIVGHEVLHQLSNKYPLLFNQLQRNLAKEFKDFESYMNMVNGWRESAGLKPLPITGASEELIADFLGEQMTNPEFWRKLGDVNPSLFQKVAKVLLDIFNKIFGVSNASDYYFKDIRKAQDILAKAISDFSEATGKGKELRKEAKMMVAAWHGSPHDFDQFQLQKIGTGEGAQAYGWGLYMASSKKVAEWYRDKLSNRGRGKDFNPTIEQLEKYFKPGNIVESYGGQDRVVSFNNKDGSWSVTVKAVDSKGNDIPGERNRTHFTTPSLQAYEKVTGEKLGPQGRLYQVTLTPNEEDFLDWDKPLSEQSEKVKGYGVEDEAKVIGDLNRNWTGADFYQELSSEHGSEEAASRYLLSLGIPGIRYLDGTSRGKGEGNSNYVIFDDSLVNIEAKMMMAPLENVKTQIVEKGVNVNSASREVLKASKPKALEAIETTVKDYDKPGRYLFRAYNAKDEKGNTVPYNPDRTHEANGEQLKGSWWTTSLATAQEIAWAKGGDVKVVALPVEKIPESVYVQNTNPPGFVYDLFLGLPQDVPLSDVQEVMLGEEVQFSLAADASEYVKSVTPGSLAASIKRILNPLDFSRTKESVERITPQSLQNAIGYLAGNPVFQAERDPMKKDFVDTAIKREEVKAEVTLRFRGFDGAKGTPPGFMKRLTKTYTSWEDVDTSTEWGRIQQSYLKLSKSDQKAVDTILTQGDVKTTVYQSLSGAMKNKKIAALNPSEAAFQVYQGVRNHIDGTVADALVDYIKQMGKEGGLSEDATAKHIKNFRAKLAKRPGWMPRNHGEGDHQVNVYHVIEDLKFSTKAIEGGYQAFLPYYAGNEATKMMRKLAADRGLHFKLLTNGEAVITAKPEMAEKIEKVIASLTRKMEKKTMYESDTAELQDRINKLQAKLAMVSLPADQQIADFVASTDAILPAIKVNYETQLQAFQEELEAADTPSEKKRIAEEIKNLGDGRVMVKRYMRLQNTVTTAERHKKEVEANISQFMPEGYRGGEKYEVSTKFNKHLSESMYGDMKADFSVEAAQESAVKRMADRGEITKQQAADLRNNIVRATAEVLMARGAGQRQIRRAPYLIEGYTTDNLPQEYDDYMNGTAGMISKALYARDQFDNFRYADAEVQPWAETYIKDSLRNMNQWDRASGNARSLATFMFLGFKVSSLLINATQIYTLGVAHLGMFTKRSAILAIGKAQKDVVGGNLTAEEKALFADHIWKLQEMETAVHEMTGANEGITGKFSKHLHILTQKALFLFQEVELMNRRTMILAAYRVLRADGMSKEEAIAKALDINRKVNFEMSRANLPGFARNAVGRTVYALQSFMWNNLNWIYNRATGGTKQDMLALLRYGGMMFLIGGAMAIPGGDELDKLFQKLTGRSIKLDWQKWSRKHAKEYGDVGLMLNDFAWHGAPSITGVNISNAIRLQIPIVSNLLSGDSVMESATGVFGGMVQKGATAAKAAGKGDTYRAVESAAPEFIAGPMRAARQAKRGVTTMSGKPVFDETGKPLKYSPLDTAKRSFGFQPLKQSERVTIAETGKALKRQWNEERQDLIDSLRIAKSGPDKQQVMRDIIKWNSKLRDSQAKGLVLPIKPDTLKRSLAAKADKKMTGFQRNYLNSK